MSIARTIADSLGSSGVTQSLLTNTLGVDPRYLGFRPASTFAEVQYFWMYSGNAGARTSAPTSLGADSALNNFHHDTNGWSEIDMSSSSYLPGSDQFYWYVRKIVYIAGSFTYTTYVDDDQVWTMIPADSSQSTTIVGGDITDTDGSQGTGSPASGNFTVNVTPGVYVWAGRGVEGGGGQDLRITGVTSGLSNIWVPNFQQGNRV